MAVVLKKQNKKSQPLEKASTLWARSREEVAQSSSQPPLNMPCARDLGYMVIAEG